MISFDLDRARRETPGCESIVHFNNAGAALPPVKILETIIGYLRREAEVGGYEAAEEAQERIEEFYILGGKFLNCPPEDIAYCQSATHAWFLAFEGLLASGRLQPGQVILTGQAEYGSGILAFSRAARYHNLKIEVVADDAEGAVCLVDLERRLRPQVGLIALTHAPTNCGLINPAAEVGRLARQNGTPYLLDACQSAGQIPLDVTVLGCDMLALTGRKYLRGPRGSGLLYISPHARSWVEPLMFDMRGVQSESLSDHFLESHSRDMNPGYRLRSDAKRYELWESSIALRLGLAAAIDYALEWGLDQIEARIAILAERLRYGLGEIDQITIRDKGRKKGGIVGFSHPVLQADILKHQLREKGIHISVSNPEMTAYDAHMRCLPPLVRASIHYYNSENEVDYFVQTISEMTNRK